MIDQTLSDKERNRAGQIVELLVPRLDSESGQAENEMLSNLRLLRANLNKLGLSFEEIFTRAANNNGGADAGLQRKLDEALAANDQLKTSETLAYQKAEQAETAMKRMRTHSFGGLVTAAADFARHHMPDMGGAFRKAAKPVGYTAGGVATLVGGSWFLAGGAGILPALSNAAYAIAPAATVGAALGGGFGGICLLTGIFCALACDHRSDAKGYLQFGAASLAISTIIGISIGGGIDLAHHKPSGGHHTLIEHAPADGKRLSLDRDRPYRVVLPGPGHG